MEPDDRLEAAYARLSAELQEKKALRSQLDAAIGEIAQRLQKLDDARVILAEVGVAAPFSYPQTELQIEGKNKVRDLILQLMESSPVNQWLPANAILDSLMQRGYEAPASRNSAYASVYVTLSRLSEEGLIAVADGSRGKVFAKRGSTEAALQPAVTGVAPITTNPFFASFSAPEGGNS